MLYLCAVLCVQNAALIYFKRFYSQASCVEHDPMRVMVTCIYLACKVCVCGWVGGGVGEEQPLEEGGGGRRGRGWSGGEWRAARVCGRVV